MNEVTSLVGPIDGNPPEGKYEYKPLNGGKQLLVEFPNGYGASVIQSGMSYGHEEGLSELAVTHEDNDDWPYYVKVGAK
jgi:hypothetical protein